MDDGACDGNWGVAAQFCDGPAFGTNGCWMFGPTGAEGAGSGSGCTTGRITGRGAVCPPSGAARGFATVCPNGLSGSADSKPDAVGLAAVCPNGLSTDSNSAAARMMTPS